MTIGGCGDIEGVMQGDTDEERSDSDYKIGSIIKTNPFQNYIKIKFNEQQRSKRAMGEP